MTPRLSTVRWRWSATSMGFVLAGTLIACAHSADRPGETAATTRPALVVVLVVDQLSQGLLARHDEVFTGGFRRLIDEGRWYVNATHDHAGTKTAPGHATLSTGVYPSRHGIIANEWFEDVDGAWVEMSNVGDSTEQIVGHPELAGVSPHYLMRSGLAEWMVAADPRTLVASVSAKDRGAVQSAAHASGHVYWFAAAVGRFVTSTYYRDRNPDWVDRFNDTVMAAHLGDTLWTSTVPTAEAWRSDPDSAAYEGDEASPHFPHRFAGPGERTVFWEWFEHTPMLDAATLDFAMTMIPAIGQGRDDVPDFLNVSVSQTDRVGHDFGALSREQLDNLLRLDRELGEFFEFLDATVGAGRWVVALSADHGTLVTGQDLRTDWGWNARYWTVAESAALDSIRAQAARIANDPATPERVVAALERLDFVAEAWTHAQLERVAPGDSFAQLAARSTFPGRAVEDFARWGVEVRYVPGFLDRELGTGHGTPYWHDRNVPMLFMGPGIPPGRDPARASTTDFAPTIAHLLGIPYPDDLDGAPLIE